MLVPIILDSDKTIVSVMIGQHNYYLLYLSIGNLHNMVYCTHRNGVKLIAFLAMPKSKLSYTTRYDAFYIWYLSYEAPCGHLYLLQILLPTLSPLTLKHTWVIEVIYDEMESEMFCWWLFLMGDLHIWALYCRLWITSAAGMYCMQLVCKVGCHAVNMLLIHYP